MPLFGQDSEVMTGSKAEKRWGEDWEMTSGQTVSPWAMDPVKWGDLSACATVPPPNIYILCYFISSK